MKTIQIVGLGIIVLFYLAHYTKVFLQKRRGISTVQMGIGEKDHKTIKVEKYLGLSLTILLILEILSIVFVKNSMFGQRLVIVGIGMAFIGVIIFVVAMWTMRDSWRAGIPANDETELVNVGIYKLSRNPAFLGFDLLYIGILIAFFNPLLLVGTSFAIIMIHMQILEEEKFLKSRFQDKYVDYQKKVGRYFLVF